MQRGIQIDKFSVSSGHPVTAFMLTHAHLDHMKYIKPRSPTIYATHVTARLATLAVQGLSMDAFIPVAYFEPFFPTPDVKCWALPSYHCDGSCMFLFELEGGGKILYTGDFRWRPPDSRVVDFLSDFTIDRVYYDDMFDEITDEFPTYADSFKELTKVVKHRDCINTSILGVEPLLRQLAQERRVRFKLSRSLQNTWRGRQLEYLLEGFMDADHGEITLGIARIDDDGVDRWIIPTCTYFLCTPEKQPQRPNRTYIQFCTHSNRTENRCLLAVVSAPQVNPCGES